MLTALLLLWAAALGWLLAWGSLGPPSTGSGTGLDRLLRRVEGLPGEVCTGDIERALLRHGLSPGDVRLVTDRAFSLGVQPFTMWMWIQVYGARELAVAVAGDLPREELLDHLCEGTVPDFHELAVLAALNGLEAATGTCPPGVRPEVRTPAERPAETRRLPPGWDSFFDDPAT